MSKPRKTWAGDPPEHCDLCHAKLKTRFVDGKVAGHGWAIMCPTCHVFEGVGLGTGQGQLYARRASKGEWVKVQG